MTAQPPETQAPPADELRAEAGRLDALYRAKARAELAAALGDEGTVSWAGDVLADVMLIKGQPGVADIDRGQALAGDDGEAITKALDALQASPSRLALCSRAIPGEDGDRIRRLRDAVEAVDPRTVIALDGEATDDIAAAFSIERPAYGVRIAVGGRVAVAVDGFEASLGDETRKRAVWSQLRALRGPLS